MRDLIWTLIVIWLVYRVVALFKGRPANAEPRQSQASFGNGPQKQEDSKENDIKRAVKQHVNKEGEFVDFEEIK